MCDEEIFEINDFSTSSDWERFIADLEEIIRQWNLHSNSSISSDNNVSDCSVKKPNSPAKGSKLLADQRLWQRKQDQLKFGRVQFSLQYHFLSLSGQKPTTTVTSDDQGGCPAWRDMNSLENDWPASGHPLVRYYGLGQFLLLQPLNGETIDTEDRARHLIGSAAIALHNLDCDVPFFCQIGDPSRRLFMGIGFISNGFRTHYQMIQFPEVPPSYRYFDELLVLFKKKLYSTFSYTTIVPNTKSVDDLDDRISPSNIRVSARYTYLLSKWPTQYLLFGPSDSETFLAEHFEYFRDGPPDLLRKPFVFRGDLFGDPLRQMQLATTWPSIAEELITDNVHHSVLQSGNAPRWSLRTLFYDPVHCRQFCRTVELLDQFLTAAQTIRPILTYLPTATDSAIEDQKRDTQRDVRSALNRLTMPVTPSASSLTSTITDQILSSVTNKIVTNNSGSIENIHVLVRNVFDQDDQITPMKDNWSQLKSAPMDSLTWRIANLSANLYCQTKKLGTLAQVWKCFVDLLRRYWHEGKVLPHISHDDHVEIIIDHGNCLLHQKLQMLDFCIRQKIKREHQQQPTEETEDDVDEFFDAEEDVQVTGTEAEGQLEVLKDSQGKVIFMLANPDKSIHVPVTQDPSPLTEDALAAQMQSLSMIDDPKAKIRLQSAGLLSDMEAFKAANPGATFEDFIRWHSPRDWIESADDDSGRMQFGLSRRMRESATWNELWEIANPVPVRRQKRLFNYTKEAEELLQWMETIQTGELVQLLTPVVAKSVLEQMFRYRSDILEFIRQTGIDTETNDFLPMDFGLLRNHFNQADYGKLVEELRFLEQDVVQFYSVLKKFTQAYRSSFGRSVANVFERNSKPATGQRKMLLKEQMDLTGNDLIRFVLDLLREPEVEFSNTDPLVGLVIRMFSDSDRFQYEQNTSVGDRIMAANNDDGWPRSSSSGGGLPIPAGKEFIIRAASVSRPAPYSRPSSHRMYCLLSNDFRLATAFTEDTSYC